MTARLRTLLLSSVAVLLLLALWSCSEGQVATVPGSGPAQQAVPPVYKFRIVNTYPHDRQAFTQGLAIDNGVLYEGTGLYGVSTLRRVKLETGEIEQIRRLPDQFFGEGIAAFKDSIIQLTWKEGTGFVYNKDSFQIVGQFTYSTEGWGITSDGKRLIMSDGTSRLYFLDPETFKETGQIEVFDNTGPVAALNELEYVRGEIFANVWKANRIARISPSTGQVTGWIELDGLLSGEDLAQPVDVLNGIAYDTKSDRLFVTGKLWPKLFEIELVRQKQ